MSTYTIGTGFSGIGVPDLAAHLLSIETLWQIERDPYCLKVLERHFPDAERYTDIFEARDLPYTDIQVYGFPCQPFSLAGKREGVKDERYLVPEMLRVIDETRPRVVVLENVPGFPTIADGDTFKQLLQTLTEMGFDAEWGHLAASDFNAPHRRERWWCVAYARSAGGTTCTAAGFGNGNRADVHGQSATAERGWHYEQSRTDGNRASLGHAEGQRHSGQPGQWADHRRSPRSQWQGLRPRSAHNGELAYAGSHHAQGSAYPGSTRARWPTAKQLTGRPGAVAGSRPAQSRLGGNAHGPAGGLDFRPFPVGPGQQQHDAEPPRVTTDKQTDRAKRLKALGNTMQLDVAYEVLQCVLAWLQEADGVA